MLFPLPQQIKKINGVDVTSDVIVIIDDPPPGDHQWKYPSDWGQIPKIMVEKPRPHQGNNE